MSTTDAKNFLDAIDTDTALRGKLKGAFDNIVQTAQQSGYNVSADDLRQELRTRWGISTPSTYQSDPDTCFFI
ncbi:MAG: Nif11-like leader peptide family natural product precursor [Thermoanaerobaculia bacterium]|jgi:predicted ribosomally synthesized peptide with nif11-like leader